MSPLQQRMLEDMQLFGLSARTQEAYARAVRQLAQHYHRRPEQPRRAGAAPVLSLSD